MKPITSSKLVKLAKFLGLAVSGDITTVTTVNEIFPNKRTKYANLLIKFREEKPNAPAWEIIMTLPIESRARATVRVSGTRLTSGSGEIDGALLPPYAKKLKKVNRKRKLLGLNPIR